MSKISSTEEKDEYTVYELMDLIKRIHEHCEIPYNGLRKEVRKVLKSYDDEMRNK